MARYEGMFAAPSNYEPLIAAPFDARSLVEDQADLINPATWEVSGGRGIWAYVGMVVTVAFDEDDSKRGVYVLVADDFTKLSNWRKCADERDIARLQEAIKNIEIAEGGASIEVETMEDLPKVGAPDVTYYVRENLSIQRWNEVTQSYLSYGGSGATPDFDNIQLIHGGNAHGTD
jgi:hypothetical protein